MLKKIILVIEFTILFFGVPLFIFFDSNIIHPSSLVLPVIIGLILYFRKQKDFHLRDLIRLDISKQMWIRQIVVLIIIALFLTGFVLVFEPENLFNLPKGNTLIWGVLMIFYPVFSAFGQEIIFRKFLFMRYRSLFRNRWLLIFASGVAFSFVHIVYFSVISLIFTFIAGVYLAWVYSRTERVLFNSILHGVLGDLVFTLGLGQHFWVDMMKWL
jgi:uncharacterized protein